MVYSPDSTARATMLRVDVQGEAEPSARPTSPTLDDFKAAASNIPTELGVELDTPLPNKPPGGK